MLTIEQAQTVLGAVGTDSPPSIEELEAAKTVFVDAARTAKEKADKPALATLLEAIKITKLAIDEINTKKEAERAELESLTADIPELSEEKEEAPEPSESEEVRMLSLTESVQRIAYKGPQVIQTEERPKQSFAINGVETNDASWSVLGEAFYKHSRYMPREGKTTVATFRTEYPKRLTNEAAANTRILDELSRAAGTEAVIAAGGCCSLAEPIRDQPLLADLTRPLSNSIPTIGATAGAVTMFPPVCLPQDGVAAWTCEQDKAVKADDPTTWKKCVEVPCVDAETVAVDAIYHCLTIGNFQQRFASARWDAILHATAAQHARIAEQTLFNKVKNSERTTKHTMTDTGSVYSSLIRALLLAAATIRQNQRYTGIRMKVWAPEWLKDATEMDLLSRAVTYGRSLDEDRVEIILARHGIDVVWSPDIAPIETAAQKDGALTEFPKTAEVLIFVDGGVYRLDGGELNMGTDVRDHDLNRQNKVAAFGESFETAIVRSCDTKQITIPVTVCSTSPCTAPAGAPAALRAKI